MTEKLSHNLVFLRGLGREKAHWGSFPKQLSNSIPNSTFSLLELPGIGSKSHLKSPNSISQIASSLCVELKELSDIAPVTLIAMSMGGMVAIELASQAPQLIKQLIIVNSSASNTGSPLSRLRIFEALKIFALKPFFSAKMFENFILNLSSNNPQRRNETLHDWLTIQKERPLRLETFTSQLTASSKWKLNTNLSSHIQKLFIYSKKDRVCHYQNTLNIHKKLGGQLLFHEHAGHDIFIDDPEWLIENMRLFITPQN